ncbi:hypothetical protein K435DRAFT_974654 [Dendrothele bispora CBS 962.96]|uniref:chitin synthase n=1 Tax=Dendrothele bispora (strain CBS 962.96) TaxID=1314807 RepID=A0A4S8KK97_DENBC|nr:hypothetical protein K435DRAFT_974654 [Dendrothele bispora CBS 962.96]
MGIYNCYYWVWVITIYMTVAAFLLAFKGINNLVKADNGLNVGSLFTNSIFRNIVLSLLATLGLYIVASLIFFGSWHMITSFIQYMLMVPSYISVLNVYAFANVHDVSWGTKGDDKVSVDLEKDIDANYEDALHVLRTKPAKVEDQVDAATQQEDYYRSFRTNVLLAWMLSNGLLAAAIVSANDKAKESGTNNSVKGYTARLDSSYGFIGGM